MDWTARVQLPERRRDVYFHQHVQKECEAQAAPYLLRTCEVPLGIDCKAVSSI